MASIILAHNQQILCTVEENYGCNFRVKTDCPIQNKCLTPKVVYEAEVTNSSDGELKTSYSLTKTTCKERHGNYITLFNYRDRMKDTELSKYIWSLTDQYKRLRVKWSIFKKVTKNSAKLTTASYI